MTTPDVPDEAVEAAARALSVRMTGFYDFNGVEVRGTYQEHARAILAVADSHIRADERARVLDEVQAALRANKAFYRWWVGTNPNRSMDPHMVKLAADYLRDTLGAGR